MNNVKAFTLVEVLVAVAILAIGIVSLLKLNVTSIFSFHKSTEITDQILTVQNICERLMNCSFDDLESECNNLETDDSVLAGDFSFHCQVISLGGGLKQIFISVYNSNLSLYTLSFYRAEGD